MADLEIITKYLGDEAASGLKGLGGALDSLGGIAAGVATAGLAAAAAGVAALGTGLAFSVGQALEAEQAQSSLTLTMNLANQTINEQAEAYMAAAGKFVTGTAKSSEELGKLQDDLTHAGAKLADMEAAMAKNEHPTQSQTLALEDQRKKIAELSAQLEEGSKVIKTSLVDALGLVPPKAGFTIDSLNKLAQEFMNLAGGSDDAIMAIEEIGLRSGAISSEQMPAFIQSVLDLGTVMGSTEQAATLLARAQEDPVAAMGRLQRAGIIFSDSLKDQIKAMVKANDIAGATALIMDRVADATGGAAAAHAETLAGQWEILKGNLGEAAETIGTSLLPTLHNLFDNFVKPAIPIITEFGTAIGTALSVLMEGDIGGAFDALMEFNSVRAIFQGLGIDLSALGTVIEDAVEWFQANLPGALAAAQTALQPVIEAVLNVVGAFRDNMPVVQQTVSEMVAFVIGQFNTLSPTLIANVSETLNQLATFWREHGDEIMAVVKVAFEFITVTVGGAMTLVSGLIASALALINGDTVSATEMMKNTWTTFMNSVLSIVGSNMDKFKADWAGDWELAKVIVTTLWTQIKDAIAAKLMEVTSGIQTAIIGAVNWLRDMIPQFVSVGNALIDGIRDGIAAATAGMIAAAVGALQAAIDAVRNAVGIHSPSTVFAGIGANLMTGMAAGITGSAAQPAYAMANAISTVTHTATISIDARGALDPAAVEDAGYRGAQRALAEAGYRGDARLRMGTYGD